MREEDEDTNDLERRLRTYFRTEDRELEAPPGLWDRLSPRLEEQRRYGWAQRIGAISLLRPLLSGGSLLRNFGASGGRKALAASMFLGTLAALGFSTIYICNNLECPFADPPAHVLLQIVAVSPVEVAPGQEFNVSGKHLDLVEEVQLRKGLRAERLFMLPLSDTGMLLVVPSGVDPEEYILETRMRGKKEFVSTKHELTVKPREPPHGARPTIFFANLNWDSVRVQNAIARFIVEKGYGNPTDAIAGEADDALKSLLNGNIQVNMEVWLPNQSKEWEQALESGSVIPLGKSLDLSWQSAFVVPTYLIEGNPSTGIAQTPDLRTVQDLRNYAEVFAKPGSNGKAVLWNCLAVWKCSKINEKQVRSYGLDDVIELRDPGSDEVLFNKVLQANENQLPWLGYMWGPTKISSSMDLTRLEEPPCEVGMSPEDGCGYEASRVRIAVHPSLISDAPDIVELLRKWDFKASTQFVAEDCLKNTDNDFEAAAVCYLKQEQAVWTQWMPSEVAQKVRLALKE